MRPGRSDIIPRMRNELTCLLTAGRGSSLGGLPGCGSGTLLPGRDLPRASRLRAGDGSSTSERASRGRTLGRDPAQVRRSEKERQPDAHPALPHDRAVGVRRRQARQDLWRRDEPLAAIRVHGTSAELPDIRRAFRKGSAKRPRQSRRSVGRRVEEGRGDHERGCGPARLLRLPAQDPVQRGGGR